MSPDGKLTSQMKGGPCLNKSAALFSDVPFSWVALNFLGLPGAPSLPFPFSTKITISRYCCKPDWHQDVPTEDARCWGR